MRWQSVQESGPVLRTAGCRGTASIDVVIGSLPETEKRNYREKLRNRNGRHAVVKMSVMD
jgi:hypothetical protein